MLLFEFRSAHYRQYVWPFVCTCQFIIMTFLFILWIHRYVLRCRATFSNSGHFLGSCFRYRSNTNMNYSLHSKLLSHSGFSRYIVRITYLEKLEWLLIYLEFGMEGVLSIILISLFFLLSSISVYSLTFWYPSLHP